MASGPACPQCGTTVERDWDWCHGCGYDPDGLRPPDAPAPAVARPRRAVPTTDVRTTDVRSAGERAGTRPPRPTSSAGTAAGAAAPAAPSPVAQALRELRRPQLHEPTAPSVRRPRPDVDPGVASRLRARPAAGGPASGTPARPDAAPLAPVASPPPAPPSRPAVVDDSRRRPPAIVVAAALLVAVVVLAVVVLATGLVGTGGDDVAGSGAASAGPLPPAADDPAAGARWTDAEDPQGRFRLELPGPPVEALAPPAAAGATPTPSLEVDLGPGQHVVVTVVPVDASVAALPPEDWIEEQALVVAGEGPDLEVTRLDVDGWPAVSLRPADPGIDVRRTVVGIPGAALVLTTTIDGNPEPTHLRALASLDVLVSPGPP